ncbi:MAG TPA: SDR family NAD(P)-dependent oxidoreductase [Arthrobacter sp.]|nr:SDR family NAD(P)-dependent oxidoreductase [Arthrobacter sp.]
MSQDLSGRTVVVAGSTSAAGVAVVHALSQAGARVAAVDILEDRVQELAAAYNNVTGYVCNLADLQAVEDFAASVRNDLGPVDGLIHLVGGWRGGTGITGQTDEDWDFLHTSVLTTLRNTSRAFYDDLAASPAGRLAVVSAQSASSPTAGGAAYAAVKSAAEAWTLAVADGFRHLQAGNESPSAQHSAALVFVVKALVDDRMRAAQPERKFPGYTDVSVLADAVQRIFDLEAEQINGQRLPLTAGLLADAPA